MSHTLDVTQSQRHTVSTSHTRRHALSVTHSVSHTWCHTLDVTHSTSHTRRHTLDVTHSTSHTQHHRLNITHSTSHTQHHRHHITRTTSKTTRLVLLDSLLQMIFICKMENAWLLVGQIEWLIVEVNRAGTCLDVSSTSEEHLLLEIFFTVAGESGPSPWSWPERECSVRHSWAQRKLSRLSQLNPLNIFLSINGPLHSLGFNGLND